MKYKACEKCAKSVGTVDIVGNLLLVLLKAYLGVVGMSKGLIADAIHSCADILATIVMIIGMKISAKEVDDKYPYGYGKAEYIVAIIIYLFLISIACYILIDGVEAIMQKHHAVPCFAAFWGGILGIAINELMFRQSLCVGTQIKSPSMIAIASECRSDVYASLAVVIGILGARIGFYWMDPLGAIVVGLLILKMCIGRISDAVLSLLDRAPEQEILKEASKALFQIDGIEGIKSVHAREVGNKTEFQVELNVPGLMSVTEGESIKKEAKRAIIRQIGKEAIVEIRLYAV